MREPPLVTGYWQLWRFRYAFSVIGILALLVVWTTVVGPSPAGPIVVLAAAVALTGYVLRRRGWATVIIDADGTTDGSGAVRQSFEDVALIWIGRPRSWTPSVFNPIMIVTYTHADVSFARRSGSRLRPAGHVEVDHRLSVPDLVADLGRWTGAPVVSGDEVPRREAERRLAVG